MDTPTEPAGLRPPLTLRRLERACLAVAALLAVLTLLAWLPPLSSHLPDGWVMMKPATAACMLLAAFIVWASPATVHWRAWFLRACCAVLVLLSAAVLAGLLPDAGPTSIVNQSPGLISSQSALGLLVLGLSLPLMGTYRGPLSIAADALALLFADFVLVMLLGYLFSASAFGESSAIHMAPPTFICFLMFVTVVVARRSGGGALAVLRGDGIGSRIVRVAIPLALVLLLSLTVIRGYVVSAGLVAPAYASAASVSFICFCVTLLALLMGWRINRLEREVRDLMQKRSDAQLQESEQRYMEAVEQAISGFVIRRPDGQLILVNEAYRKMTGYSREELLGLSAKDLVVDQGVIERVQRLQPGESIHIETFLKRKDGSLLEVEYVTQRLRNGNFQSFLLDISHRKNIQKARDESERRYAELVDQALEGITVRRPNGALVFVNEIFCRMLGYPREELLRLNIKDVVHPDDAETLQQIQQLGHGGHLHLHKRMRRQDGGVIYVEVSAKRLRNGDIQTTVQDVTERHIAEQAHAESEQRYQDLVEQAADAIWLRKADGRMVFVNDAGCALLGYTREELLRSNSAALIHDSDPGTSARMDALQPLETLRVERVMRHKDGHPIPVEASSHRLADGSIQVISHDITERKRSLDELREMSRRLSEAQETERRAIARELHDEVGQSLTATRINLRDLEQQAEGGPLAQRLTDTAAIIAELLSKVRQMSLDLHPSVLDDLGVVAALRWCVRTRIAGGSLQVVFDLPEDLPRFDDMAEITLFRVFQEALSNVLRHAQAGHVQVTLRHAAGKLDLSMKDDGVGFDSEAARRRAMSGKSLGLLGMQERVRLAGGGIVLESAPGQGTQLRVSLPATER
jgi:PAS domain S-box-containing protein